MGGGISLILNVLLIVAVVVGEHYGHSYRQALVRRDLVERVAIKTPGYWEVHSWTNTLKKMRIDCDIVFFGNSITCGSDFQADFPDKKIINLGLSGDILPGMMDRLAMVECVHPKKIFIMAGTNDLGHVSVEQYLARYRKLIGKLKEDLPETKVYLQSVLPINTDMRPDCDYNDKILEANKAVRSLAEEYGCTFIDLYHLYEKDGQMNKELTKDGVHLKPQAYSLWANAITKYIYE